MIWRS